MKSLKQTPKNTKTDSNSAQKTPKTPDVKPPKSPKETPNTRGMKTPKTPDLNGQQKTPDLRDRISDSLEDECHRQQPHIEVCSNASCSINSKGASFEVVMNAKARKLKKKLFESSSEESPSKKILKSPSKLPVQKSPRLNNSPVVDRKAKVDWHTLLGIDENTELKIDYTIMVGGKVTRIIVKRDEADNSEGPVDELSRKSSELLASKTGFDTGGAVVKPNKVVQETDDEKDNKDVDDINDKTGDSMSSDDKKRFD